MAISVVVGFCLALSAATKNAADPPVAMVSILVIFFIKNPIMMMLALKNSSSSTKKRREEAATIIAMALAVTVAARLSSSFLPLATALMVPCLYLFPLQHRYRTAALLLAIIAIMFGIWVAPPDVNNQPHDTAFFISARLVLAIDFMILPSHHNNESIIFSALLVIIVLCKLDFFSCYYYYYYESCCCATIIIGILPAILLFFVPPQQQSHKKKLSLFSLAVGTTIGLCAAQDHGMEVLLLLIHSFLHLILI